MNSTPAFSRAARSTLASAAATRTGPSSASACTIVEAETRLRSARSSALHRTKARAARSWLPVIGLKSSECMMSYPRERIWPPSRSPCETLGRDQDGRTENKPSHPEEITSADPLHAHDCSSRKLSQLLPLVGNVHHHRAAVPGRFLTHHHGGCLAVRVAQFEAHLQIGGLALTERMDRHQNSLDLRPHGSNQWGPLDLSLLRIVLPGPLALSSHKQAPLPRLKRSNKPNLA